MPFRTSTLLQTALRARAATCTARPTPLILLRTSPTLLKINHSHAFSSAARRLAASEVSGKPASENLSHATQNAKEEAGAVAHTIAKGIAGAGGKGDYDPASITRTTDAQSHGASEPLKESFGNLTSTIASTVPKHILVFGLAGGLPYLGASFTTLYVARQASQAASGLSSTVDIQSAIALLDSCSHIQVTYGAVMLSFLGAIHWGFEFAKYGGYQGYSRLVLGVAPLLAAWPTLTMEPQLALVAQWFIFTSLWYADMKATTAGWTPAWYSQYRFYLSILVGVCILSTLFGVNYLGPTTDMTLANNLKETGVIGSSMGFMDYAVKAETDATDAALKKKSVPGDAQFWTEAAGDDDGAFIKIMKKQEEEDTDEEGGEDAKEGDDSEESDEESKGGDGGKEDGEEKKDEGDDNKKDAEPTDSGEQKNPKAGGPGENMDSAKQEKKEGVVKSRDGASKKDDKK